MDKWKLWHTFETSGRVEDYLRYRGFDPSAVATDCIQKEAAYGERSQTASDDRRSDSAGL